MTASQAAQTASSERNPDFLSGGGELGALMRAFSWETTSLGAPETWPQSLKLAIRIMLASQQPIWIGWGADLVYFYNDPYKSIIGGKHPWALGRPTREVWSEIWPQIGPMLEQASRGDQGTYVESQLLIMERNGYPEETYYTFSYSPIPNEGEVGGIFCANSDDTQKIIGGRQLASLRDLAAEAGHARNWREACERAAIALEKNARDLPFAMIYIAERDSEIAELAGAAGIEPGAPLAPAILKLERDAIWPVGEVLEAQEVRLLPDLPPAAAGPVPSGPWPRPPDRAALIPIPPTGETGRAGVLLVGLNPFRVLDEDYQGFLKLAAGQIASAIANAQAYEEERRRAEALAEIDRAKTTFFSNISHEFRTPLTLMLAPLEDALRDAPHEVGSVERQRLETAHRNSLRLLKLVNSLLDFSRIEAGRTDMSFERVDLAGLTHELAANFESASARAGLTLRINCRELSQPVYVDRDMWEKIVLNLVSNAFKFTFEGGIEVDLRESSDGRSAELVVRDTGVGIPASELPRLFERFHRIEGQRGRSFEGSGIGLALVQELVRLHGGAIRVESEPDRGSAFTVSIPLGAGHLAADRIGRGRSRSTSLRAGAFVEEALRWLPEHDTTEGGGGPDDRAHDAPEPGVETPAPSARVLVADDNADMRAYLRRLLGARFQVETAADGEAALAAIRARRPDLLLTDVMMPRLDGFGLLRAVRNDPELRDLPVIFLSARAGEDARVEGLDANADDYLTKPFSARELVARVSANLAMARIRREATRELRESEARFRNMAEHSPVMMWMTDACGSITYLNRVWREFTGLSLEEVSGFASSSAVHPEDREPSRRAFLDARAAREAFRTELRLRRSDGVYRWALTAATPRFDDDGQFLGFIGSIIDITERKEAEQILKDANASLKERVTAAVAESAAAQAQLIQAQKMEAVGKLTGGVAHDFNNVLQIISGNLQLIGLDVAGNTRAEHRLQTAVSAIARGSKLASHLLAFGRRQPLAPKVVNLGRLIHATDDMLRRAIGEGVEIETMIAGGLWNTFVDAVQVENALLNLAINSRDAMAGHGKLTIEAGNAYLDDDYVARHSDVAAGQYVMIAVSDTGAGIPAAILDKVFEPFFTTKPEGQGTGLGLSMVYGFVKQSGGHIKIYSEPGNGTTVRIYLPRARGAEDVEAPAEVRAAEGDGETVLVVEDDEDVRTTVVDMLSGLGYRVLKARDADSALAIVESGAAIDLLFTDVVMPGKLRSPDLARRTKERLPDVAVLFTSGYTENAIVHGGRLDEGIELLSKPYSREALARKIRHVLAARAQRAQVRPARGAAAVEAPDASRALRILLVEDDALIRFATADMLTELGHTVEEAGDAEAALAMLEGGRFDVVVTDLSLPGMSGEALAERARERDPDLGVVFATGYAAAERKRGSTALEDAVVLQKPYDESGLAAALKAATRRTARRKA